jgi:putative oxidoreductase
MKEDIGKLVFRVALGAMMLLHGISKLRHGIDGIITNVHAHGLPTAFAYGVFLGEIIGPLLVIVGSGTRIGAALVAFDMIVAVWLAHAGQFFEAGKSGGWALELQGLYFFGAVAIALLGPGRYSLSRGKGRFA